jgi:phosphoglycolate phosphatase-like HAD superfamily hydrolase
LFYDRLLGRAVTDVEWSSIDTTFHDSYAAIAPCIPLAGDAREAVEMVANAGGSQSILSMWWHKDLVPEVERHGLERFMLRVDGNNHDAGESKQRLLEIHLQALATGNGAVMIGDALDDASAARDVGIPCVMYNGGSHYRSELKALGFPVADTLLEAAQIGLEL